MNKRTFFIFTLIVVFISSIFLFVFAEDSVEDLEKKIEEYSNKIEQLQNTASTLSQEMEYMNSQISLTELRIQSSLANITKKEDQIIKLTKEIDDLKIRISKLSDSIGYQRDLLNSRSRERYKTRDINPFMVIFGSDTFNTLMQKTEYLQQIEVQDKKLLDEMENTKKSYDTQKDIFENKREQEEDLKKQLVLEQEKLSSYKSQLDNQKNEKQQLLAITQNDETKYASLLAEAKAQLASFGAFTQSSGGGVIGPNGLGGGDDGWYYSQRDSRWAYNKIGKSNYNIFDVGCLVTSVAMLHTYYGFDVTPAKVASWNDKFFYGSMYIPWPAPSGRKYTPISISNIDSELSKGNPVIVGIYANNSAGTHFLVLIEDTGKDWKMYDPWNGPDLDFSDYYSSSSIFQAVVFK